MKKTIISVFIICAGLVIPLTAFATPSSVDRITDHIQPLIQTDYIRGDHYIATSTTASSTLPKLNSTIFNSTTLCIGGDCKVAWPSGGSGTVTNIATTFPILGGPIITTGTLTFGGLSTSSPVVVSNIPYFSGANTFANVATTSHSFSGPFSITGTIGTLIGGANSTVTWTGLATTTTLASSNLLVSNGASGVYGVATSTLSASSPLTGSFVQIGSGGALGCQTASGSQAGCLSSTDWTTFDNKGSGTVTSVTGTWPINSSGGTTPTISWVGLATTSQPASSNVLVSDGVKGIYGVATSSETCTWPQLCAAHVVLSGGGAITWGGLSTSSNAVTSAIPYFSGVNTLANVATTSHAFSGPFSVSGTIGALIGGANSTITWTGLATSSNTVTSNLFYGTSATGSVGNVATTSLGVTSPITFSGTLGAQVGGASGNFACATCNTTNATVSSVATTWPITGGPITTTGTLIWAGLATTSQPASSNLLVSDGVKGLYGVATSSLSAGTGLSGSFNYIGSGGSLALTVPVAISSGGTATTTGGFTNGLETYNGTTLTNYSGYSLSSSLLTALNASTTNLSIATNASFNGVINSAASQPATSTAITLNWGSTVPQIEYQIGISATTLTIFNATTSVQWGSRKLIWVCNPPAASGGALTWIGVEWVGSAPTQTTTAGQCDVYSFDITLATSTSVYKVAGSQGAGFQ